MNQNFRRVVAVTLFTLALSAAAFAQGFRHQVRANILFSFYAGGKVMPAGNYTFSIDLQNPNIQIFQMDKGIGAFLLGSPHDGSNDDRTLLTFCATDEGVYMLRELRGPDFGLSFSAGKRRSQLVENRPANATQTVVARLMK